MALFEDKESLERSLRQWEATQVAKDAEIASAWTAYEATRAPLEAAKAQVLLALEAQGGPAVQGVHRVALSSSPART